MEGPGLFGKTPETGDFISRGLAPGLRRALDGWVTAHLAERRENWPEGGVRGLLDLEGALVLFVAVASRDSVGRRYPLLAVTGGEGLSLEDAEAWCGAAHYLMMRAAEGESSIWETLDALRAMEPRQREGPMGVEAIWVAGGDPWPADAETLNDIFSSG